MTRIRALSRRVHAWVESVGWHNKSDLAALSLISSEIGEAANECRGASPTPDFGPELADVLLRVADFAECHRLDLDFEISSLHKSCCKLSFGLADPLELLALVAYALGDAIGAVIDDPESPRLGPPIARMIILVGIIAKEQGIDIIAEANSKMDVNEARGTRGRLV